MSDAPDILSCIAIRMGVKETAATLQQLAKSAAAPITPNIFGRTVEPTAASKTCRSSSSAKTTSTGPWGKDLKGFVVDDGYETRAAKNYRGTGFGEAASGLHANLSPDNKRKRSDDDQEDYKFNGKELRSELEELQSDSNVWDWYEYVKGAREEGAEWILEPVDRSKAMYPAGKTEHDEKGRSKRRRTERVELKWTDSDLEKDDQSDNSVYAEPQKKARKKTPAAAMHKGSHHTTGQNTPFSTTEKTSSMNNFDGAMPLRRAAKYSSAASPQQSTPLFRRDGTPLKQFKKFESSPASEQKTHCTDEGSSDEETYEVAPEYQSRALPTPPSTPPPSYASVFGPVDMTQRLLNDTIVLRDLAARMFYNDLRHFAYAWDKLNDFVTSGCATALSYRREKAILIKALETQTGEALDFTRERAMANFDLVDDSQCEIFWELLSDPELEPVDRKLLLTFGSMDKGDLDLLLSDGAELDPFKIEKE